MRYTQNETPGWNRGHGKVFVRDEAHYSRASVRQKGFFLKSDLPSPHAYCQSHGLKLKPGGAWRMTSCPLHEDKKPSLAINMTSGGFRCHSCGIHGGNVLALHMALTGLSFKEAAIALGAWGGHHG